MLSAEQIEELGRKAEQLLDPVVAFLIQDIAERVAGAGQLTSTAAYEVWTAQNLGLSQKDLKEAIQKKLNVSMKEVEQLLTQAAEVGYNFDISQLPTSEAIPFVDNTSLQQTVAAAVVMAQEDLTNLTKTMGFIGSDGKARTLTKAYQQACDTAFEKVLTGTQDYASAIREATRNLAKKGIVSVDYKSGQSYSIEAAVRQNIMGGLGLMQEQISQQNHDDLGCDGWELSAHAASAPDHEPYQGKQYTDEEYTALNNMLRRRIGTLNCGHAAFPIILGVNEPQYTEEELEQFRQDNEAGVTVDGRHYTMYEATQRQRQYERTIRNRKRRILIDEALEDADQLQTDQIRLVRLRDEYKRFSKSAGLPMQHERMETAGFTWKHGKAAEKVASRNYSVAEYIGRSVGAKAKNYKVYNPVTGEDMPLTEGTRITQPKNHVVAGKGRKRQIDELQFLLDKYGGDPLEWTKEKGFGYVDDEYGDSHYVELHWYQEPTAGKVKMKIKVQPDGRIYLEED